MEEQEKVADFIEENDLNESAEFRILDLVSEVGEVAKDANESTGYGESPEELEIKRDEIGDVFFSLLALAESLDIDTGEALDEALEKYRGRIKDKGSLTSG